MNFKSVLAQPIHKTRTQISFIPIGVFVHPLRRAAPQQHWELFTCRRPRNKDELLGKSITDAFYTLGLSVCYDNTKFRMLLAKRTLHIDVTLYLFLSGF